MVLWRMIIIALRLAWPYWLAPWRSPLLRWRMETYGIRDERGVLLHAADITPARFVRFMITHGQALWTFLRWAAQLPPSARAHRVVWS